MEGEWLSMVHPQNNDDDDVINAFFFFSLQVTVYDQENFQGKRLEFTSACQNIMECGVDNIRSLKVECGA